MSSAAALGVCLMLASQAGSPGSALPAAASDRVRFVPVQRFTLAWTHSIEKIRWEEDYHVRRQDQAAPTLVLDRARVKGSGAGMDPPADAVFRDGWYEYTPTAQPDGPLRLTRSEFTADFDWCPAGRACAPLADVLPSDGGVTLLWPCLDKMTP